MTKLSIRNICCRIPKGNRKWKDWVYTGWVKRSCRKRMNRKGRQHLRRAAGNRAELVLLLNLWVGLGGLWGEHAWILQCQDLEWYKQVIRHIQMEEVGHGYQLECNARPGSTLDIDGAFSKRSSITIIHAFIFAKPYYANAHESICDDYSVVSGTECKDPPTSWMCEHKALAGISLLGTTE